MQIIFLLLAFLAGLILGVFIIGRLIRTREVDGIIVVKKEDEKIIYSLEITSDPELLQYAKLVLFKIQVSDDELNRE